MSQELTTWNPEQTDILRRELFPNITDSQLGLFAQVCKRTGLDPFAKQIYAVVRKSKDGPKMTIQTGIDGYRLTAQRSGRYHGQTTPEWHDGKQWHDVWLDADTPPAAARVGVYLKGSDRPTYGIAMFAEYAQKAYNGSLVAMWQNMPANQLAKCAEALALRKAFPAELAGVYTPEEMTVADVEEINLLTTEQLDIIAVLERHAGATTGSWTGKAATKPQDAFASVLAGCIAGAQAALGFTDAYADAITKDIANGFGADEVDVTLAALTGVEDVEVVADGEAA